MRALILTFAVMSLISGHSMAGSGHTSGGGAFGFDLRSFADVGSRRDGAANLIGQDAEGPAGQPTPPNAGGPDISNQLKVQLEQMLRTVKQVE